jgi:phosphatidate cytidylyltransferase
VESGVVGFEDVEDLSADEAYAAPGGSDLGLRVVTGLVLAMLLVGAVWAGGEALAAFIALLMMVALVEFYTTLRMRGYRPMALFGYIGGAGTFALAWFLGPVAISGGLIATTVLVFFVYALTPDRRDALTNGGLTVLGVGWIVGTTAFAFPIIDSPQFRPLVMGIVVGTVAMDVGAYSAGRSFGSRAMAPVLSPNKTLEGLAGGVILTIGACVLFGHLFEPFDIRSGAALGLAVAFAAPLGDLVESMLKRSLGVKDMGSILPGHGGILDRVDAFLFVVPVAWAAYRALGFLG